MNLVLEAFASFLKFICLKWICNFDWLVLDRKENFVKSLLQKVFEKVAQNVAFEVAEASGIVIFKEAKRFTLNLPSEIGHKLVLVVFINSVHQIVHDLFGSLVDCEFAVAA